VAQDAMRLKPGRIRPPYSDLLIKSQPQDEANKTRISLNENEPRPMSEESQISTGPVWTTDDLPACPVGIDLLRRFQAARPNDYAFLEVQDFDDLNTSGFDGILEWDAFTEHCAPCEECKKQRLACAER
jgi:hypothetical protein